MVVSSGFTLVERLGFFISAIQGVVVGDVSAGYDDGKGLYRQ
jgi:hypothetical protein